MSELDSMYREVILDHYKNPRGHGVIEGADAEAEGLNPLCGDEVAIFVSFDGDRIEDVKFRGRGCAISQAATSMLMEMVRGRPAQEVAEMSRDELLEEVGIPLTPIRLKCALLGLGVLKVALHRGKGTSLPDEWSGLAEAELKRVCPGGATVETRETCREASESLREPTMGPPYPSYRITGATEAPPPVRRLSGAAFRQP